MQQFILSNKSELVTINILILIFLLVFFLKRKKVHIFLLRFFSITLIWSFFYKSVSFVVTDLLRLPSSSLSIAITENKELYHFCDQLFCQAS